MKYSARLVFRLMAIISFSMPLDSTFKLHTFIFSMKSLCLCKMSDINLRQFNDACSMAQSFLLLNSSR
ncbi:hypothetical protein BpHYR1_016071 [Brachionus plicatilis]|uniref:Uncharacterized protein n=1 Tax=Brachionus plicatilis TaxID=10195 RepID=A0A3M7SAC6_BRAPC|nr:hypothetical protein BpHYR1_016071 [Brachionus plicatilis]